MLSPAGEVGRSATASRDAGTPRIRLCRVRGRAGGPVGRWAGGNLGVSGDVWGWGCGWFMGIWGTCSRGILGWFLGWFFLGFMGFHDGIYTICGIYGRIYDLWGSMGFHTVFFFCDGGWSDIRHRWQRPANDPNRLRKQQTNIATKHVEKGVIWSLTWVI